MSQSDARKVLQYHTTVLVVSPFFVINKLGIILRLITIVRASKYFIPISELVLFEESEQKGVALLSV